MKHRFDLLDCFPQSGDRSSWRYFDDKRDVGFEVWGAFFRGAPIKGRRFWFLFICGVR